MTAFYELSFREEGRLKQETEADRALTAYDKDSYSPSKLRISSALALCLLTRLLRLQLSPSGSSIKLEKSSGGSGGALGAVKQ